ncbi:immunoglobulin kappa light chain-like [Alligator mississippiensis]|uniref:immunoglobulin kappa light chain-like n=1 Tax=Alligator mississippiensis TaxID=8496 RepID=UPI002877CEDB|nr:immunoglobulin kappa light chain-like [Alligator mississippiensis]
MISQTGFLWLLLLWAPGSSGQVAMTQTPESLSVVPGQTVTINCKASSSIGSYAHWYQKKPRQTPKLVIYNANNHPSGIPDRFSGSGSGTDFTLTISHVEADDAGDYYCSQSGYSAPSHSESHGQIVITPTPASVTVLPGETLTIQRKASSSVGADMSLFLFKSGQNTKLFIPATTSRVTRVPDRFSGSYSSTVQVTSSYPTSALATARSPLDPCVLKPPDVCPVLLN